MAEQQAPELVPSQEHWFNNLSSIYPLSEVQKAVKKLQYPQASAKPKTGLKKRALGGTVAF